MKLSAIALRRICFALAALFLACGVLLGAAVATLALPPTAQALAGVLAAAWMGMGLLLAAAGRTIHQRLPAFPERWQSRLSIR